MFVFIEGVYLPVQKRKDGSMFYIQKGKRHTVTEDHQVVKSKKVTKKSSSPRKASRKVSRKASSKKVSRKASSKKVSRKASSKKVSRKASSKK